MLQLLLFEAHLGEETSVEMLVRTLFPHRYIRSGRCRPTWFNKGGITEAKTGSVEAQLRLWSQPGSNPRGH